MNPFGSLFELSPTAKRAAGHLRSLALLMTAAIGTAVGVSLWMTTPAREGLERAQSEYQAARQMQVRLQAALRTQEDLNDVWKLLPPRKDFPTLILSISDLAKQDNVELPGMTYMLDKTDGGLALKAAVTFQVAGDYAGIRAFIQRLETTGPYLFIESLDASRSTQIRRPTKVSTESGTSRPAQTTRAIVVFNVRVVTFLRPDAPVQARKAGGQPPTPGYGGPPIRSPEASGGREPVEGGASGAAKT
jgi:Pilus assembly protein, PilO